MENKPSILANHFRKLKFPWSWAVNIFLLNFLNPYGYADGGKIIFMGTEILFKPHFFNAPGGKLTIALKDIKRAVKNPGAIGNVKNVSLFLKNGREERFVIYAEAASNLISLLKKKGISAR